MSEPLYFCRIAALTGPLCVQTIALSMRAAPLAKEPIMSQCLYCSTQRVRTFDKQPHPYLYSKPRRVPISD